ncbi:hypothetical protein MD484_g8973, partial [Candolleomyces efflorescens]
MSSEQAVPTSTEPSETLDNPDNPSLDPPMPHLVDLEVVTMREMSERIIARLDDRLDQLGLDCVTSDRTDVMRVVQDLVDLYRIKLILGRLGETLHIVEEIQRKIFWGKTFIDISAVTLGADRARSARSICYALTRSATLEALLLEAYSSDETIEHIVSSELDHRLACITSLKHNLLPLSIAADNGFGIDEFFNIERRIRRLASGPVAPTAGPARAVRGGRRGSAGIGRGRGRGGRVGRHVLVSIPGGVVG